MSAFCFEPGCRKNLQANIQSDMFRKKDFKPYNYQKNLDLINEVCAKAEFLGQNMPIQARVATIKHGERVLEIK